MGKSKKKFRVGDLIACYNNADEMKIIAGWITDVYMGNNKVYLYKIRWGDIDENDTNRVSAPVPVKTLHKCHELLQKAIELDIWSGKKIL